jgi:hypothetical protein
MGRPSAAAPRVSTNRGRDIPIGQCLYTNNVSERHLRPSVIFRKVINGFRCEWGAETYGGKTYRP